MGHKRLDITGEVNGNLTALEYVGSNSKNKRSLWRFRCVCGGEVVSTVTSVRTGNRKSCGCVRLEKASTLLKQRSRKLPGYACLISMYHSYKSNAVYRSLLFTLTKEQFEHIVQQPCHYCGALPANVATVPWNTDRYVYGGIDRVDNTQGYVTQNVVPCCKVCNLAKKTMTVEEFFTWIKRVAIKHNLLT